jgi:hypothetical protein
MEYLKTLIWGLDPIEFLPDDLFDIYMNLLKSFYTEDIQTSLNVFGIREMINYVLDILEAREICCRRHAFNSALEEPESYRKRLGKYF